MSRTSIGSYWDSSAYVVLIPKVPKPMEEKDHSAMKKDGGGFNSDELPHPIIRYFEPDFNYRGYLAAAVSQFDILAETGRHALERQTLLQRTYGIEAHQEVLRAFDRLAAEELAVEGGRFGGIGDDQFHRDLESHGLL